MELIGTFFKLDLGSLNEHSLTTDEQPSPIIPFSLNIYFSSNVLVSSSSSNIWFISGDWLELKFFVCKGDIDVPLFFILFRLNNKACLADNPRRIPRTRHPLIGVLGSYSP